MASTAADTERRIGVPVGVPPMLGAPREARAGEGYDPGSSSSSNHEFIPGASTGSLSDLPLDTGTGTDTASPAGAGVPRQRAAAEDGSVADLGTVDGSSAGAPTASPAGVAWPPVSTTSSDLPPVGAASEPRVVSVASLGAKSTSAAFDPQTPQPLPERIRPLVGALMANAARVGLKLTLSCGRRVTVTCAGCGRLPASALASGGAAWSLLDAGLPTPGVLSADDPVALALADVLLGGTGTVTRRAPERVEASVLRRHLGRALSPLIEPLLPYGVSTLDLREPPPDTTAPELLGGAEMFAIRLTVELESGPLEGAIVIALPYRTLFGTAGTADVPRDEAANRALAAVPVDLTVRFPATTLPAYDVAGLEPGDVLRLEVAQPYVEGLVDGVQLLSGSLGRSGRRRAILVSSLESRLEDNR